jgi:hypothetical protein
MRPPTPLDLGNDLMSLRDFNMIFCVRQASQRALLCQLLDHPGVSKGESGYRRWGTEGCRNHSTHATGDTAG